MNERLKELYLQAHSIRRYDNDPSREGNPPTIYWQGEVSAQRFAELILKECLDIISPYAIRMENFDGGHPITELKKHFGVEE